MVSVALGTKAELLLIRRSLVRAQVEEPKNFVVVLALSQSSGVGFLHSGGPSDKKSAGRYRVNAGTTSNRCHS